MTTYIRDGFGFDVGYDFSRASGDTEIEIDEKAYAKPGHKIGYIAGDPAHPLGFLRSARVRVHVRKNGLIERERIAGYAAVRRGKPGEDDMCFAYGDTLAECKRAAQRQLQVPDNQMGCRLYSRLEWEPLTAEDASEVSSMLDAEWVF